MSVAFETSTSTGRTLFVSLQKIQEDGTLGDTWDTSASNWGSSVTDANSKIAMTEGTGRNIGSYTTGVSGALSTYTGYVLVRVHDDDLSDQVIGVSRMYLSVGELQDDVDILSAVSGISASAGVVGLAPSRVWALMDEGEFSQARNIITVGAGAEVTVGFDFAERLNQGTGLNTITAISVAKTEAGSAPSLSSNTIDPTKRQAQVTITSTVLGRYQIKATVTTTDGQTLVGFGWLYVE